MTNQVGCKGERKNAYRVVVGKPKGKRSHKKPLKRWEVNISLDFKYVGWESVWGEFV
jgi:hypothetical protein